MFRLVKERRILAEGKKMRINTRLFEAIATLIGTTIGAGVLGIPYVVAQSGLAVGLLHIIIIGTAAIMVNLLLGEIVLRTKGNHQLSGYAAKSLGEGGKKLMTLAM
ncbi:MAG TPA: aromatic amino acid transport family protein, partial [Candidatus Nanoarchaeia archaeon]|nr:aromatic amino acid transport family protein [Candidatus Nanoarchaeia archaeon]